MFPLAILQGRLSPDLQGRFQFFPEAWEKEFLVARDLGFSGIEWLIDPRDWRSNPVFEKGWEEHIARLVKETGIAVTSFCADWFMECAPWEGDTEEHQRALVHLAHAAQYTTRKVILLPLLEKNTIIHSEFQTRTREMLMPIVPVLESVGATIAFETELARDALAAFVDSFCSPAIGVYYDIGNCTSYGFDCPADIRFLGERVKGVHVKDRRVSSTQSIPLGTGDADLPGCLKALTETGWDGTLVLQSWRGEDYLQDAMQARAVINRVQYDLFHEHKSF